MPGLDLPSGDDFDPEADDLFHPTLTKERRYLHFDLPLSSVERERHWDFSRESEKHRFFPLLGFSDVRRRLVHVDGKLVVKQKPRPIRYASHGDAAYLQAYSAHVGRIYENRLQADGIDRCVLAYRKGGRTNIHHAKSLFDEIRARRNCTVLALDVSGFFDCLEHKHLKECLINGFGCAEMAA